MGNNNIGLSGERQSTHKSFQIKRLKKKKTKRAQKCSRSCFGIVILFVFTSRAQKLKECGDMSVPFGLYKVGVYSGF